MGRYIALGANRSTRYCAHIDDLEERRAQRSKGAKAVMLYSVSWKRPFVVALVLRICIKIYFFSPLLFVLSSLQVGENSVSCTVFLLSLTFASVHTWKLHVPLSPVPHTNRHRFHLSRPTVFLLDVTPAPANRLQCQDMSDISRNLIFMGLVFLPHFA